jgi:hypothetical protein
MSQPSLPKRFAGIYQLAVKRVAALPKLLSIAGRLELMLAQISKHTGKGRDPPYTHLGFAVNLLWYVALGPPHQRIWLNGQGTEM